MINFINRKSGGGGSDYPSAFIVEKEEELNNISAVENDIAFLYDRTYIPTPNSTLNGKYCFYFPKIVQEEYVWSMPDYMDGSVSLSKLNATLSLIINGDNIIKFTLSPANSIWEGHNEVTIQYELQQNELQQTIYVRTRIYDTNSNEDLDNTSEFIFIDSGLLTDYTNWNDHVAQFTQVDIGKKVSKAFKYNGTEWEIEPFGVTASKYSTSYFEIIDNILMPGTSFIGTNGYEIGSLDIPNKFDDSTMPEIIKSRALTILNILQSYINKLSTVSNNYSSQYYSIRSYVRGFPIRTDGTCAAPVTGSLSNTFSGNLIIYIIPKGLITNQVTSLIQTFESCKRICTVEHMDTSNVTNMKRCFYKNYSLENVPVLNLEKVTNMENCFYNCPVLTNESLNNILQSCITATLLNTKTLKYIGLTDWQTEKCKTLSNYQAFINAGWTTGYESED